MKKSKIYIISQEWNHSIYTSKRGYKAQVYANNQEKKIFHTLGLYSFMMDISYEKKVSRYTI
jgi:hypothetical protein